MTKGIHADRITVEMRVTRFWMQVARAGDDECWIWTGYGEKGYGKCFDGDRMRPAHELALTYTTGEQRPEGFDTCHSCHTPLCCNPRHLRFDSRQGNVDDTISARRQARGETNGHARLTVSDVTVILERAASGATGRALAREYGVTEGAITNILRGRNWKHVAGPRREQHGNTKHGRYVKP